MTKPKAPNYPLAVRPNSRPPYQSSDPAASLIPPISYAKCRDEACGRMPFNANKAA